MAPCGLKRFGRLLVAAFAALFLLVPASAQAGSYAKRTLKVGSHGKDVKTLQKYLTRVGIRTSADGEYGKGTAASVKRYENAAGRHVDGTASRSDQKAVKKSVKKGDRVASDGKLQRDDTTGSSDQPPPPTNTASSEVNDTGKAKLSSDGRTAI